MFYSSDRGPLQRTVVAAAAQLLPRWVPREAATAARKGSSDEAQAPRPRPAAGLRTARTPRPTGVQHRASPPSLPGERRSSRPEAVTGRFHRDRAGFVPARHQPAHRPSAPLQAAPRPVHRAALGPRSSSPPTGAAAARHLRRGHDAAARHPRSSLPRGARPRGGTPGPRDASRPCAGRRKMAAGQNGAPRHPIPHPAHRMASSSWSR